MNRKTTSRHRTPAKSLVAGIAAGAIAVSLCAAPFAMAVPPSLPSGATGGMGQTDSNTVSSSKAKATVTANGKTVTKKSKTIKATSKDRNAALAKNGGTLKLTSCTLKKSGSDSNDDNCNFYGLNSTLLSVGSTSKAYVSSCKLSSTSTGSNGLFATAGGKIFANNTTITTKKGANARGIDATYGGYVYGNKLTISTQKDHCAALATDRGGGYVSVTNSKATTAGSGSPLIYSTGDIEVNKLKGTAKGSQIVGVEGSNKVLVKNSTLTSTSDALSGSDPIKNGVIIYQSTSGDADTSTSSTADFEAVNSKLKTSITSGALFYVTNTTAKIVLKNSKLSFKSGKVDLIDAVGNSSNNWGTSGKNGGKVTLTGIKQKLKGTIKVDTISRANVYLLSKTTYTGKTKIVKNSQGTTSSKGIYMNIDATSKWVVTGSCKVTKLNVAKGGKVVDASGRTVTIKAGGKTVVKGTSPYTVTVAKSYSTSVSTSSQNKLSSTMSRSAFDKHFGTSTAFSMK